MCSRRPRVALDPLRKKPPLPTPPPSNLSPIVYSSKGHFKKATKPSEDDETENVTESETRTPNTVALSPGSSRSSTSSFSRTSNSTRTGHPLQRQPRNRTASALYEEYRELNIDVDPLAELAELGVQSDLGQGLGWTHASKNWVMWTVWDLTLAQLPIYKESVAGREDAERLVIGRTRQGFVQVLQKIFDRLLMAAELKQYLQSGFIMLVVTDDVEAGFIDYSQRFELGVNEVEFETHSSKSRRSTVASPSMIVSCAGLAEILSTVLEPTDILVILGGYLLEPSIPHGATCALNFNRLAKTGILRIRQNSGQSSYPAGAMIEKIEPTPTSQRYKFTYKAMFQKFRREVVQHRDFSRDTFCRHVSDTLAFSRSRWDFPVPISRSHAPNEMFQLFLSEELHLPPTPPRARLSPLLEESTDESFHTVDLLSSSPESDTLRAPLDKRSKIYFEDDTESDNESVADFEVEDLPEEVRLESKHTQTFFSGFHKTRSQGHGGFRRMKASPCLPAFGYLRWLLLLMAVLLLVLGVVMAWERLRARICQSCREPNSQIGGQRSSYSKEESFKSQIPFFYQSTRNGEDPEKGWGGRNYFEGMLDWFWEAVDWVKIVDGRTFSR